jgi:hypothetical protein
MVKKKAKPTLIQKRCASLVWREVEGGRGVVAVAVKRRYATQRHYLAVTEVTRETKAWSAFPEIANGNSIALSRIGPLTFAFDRNGKRMTVRIICNEAFEIELVPSTIAMRPLKRSPERLQ